MRELSYPSRSYNPAEKLAAGWKLLDASSAAQLLDLLYTWHQRRRSRGNLIGMPDVMLKDIGLSRSDAEQEWEKPFWRG